MINDNTLQLIQIHNVHKNMIESSYRLHMDLVICKETANSLWTMQLPEKWDVMVVLQPLSWRGVECLIHHTQDICEE